MSDTEGFDTDATSAAPNAGVMRRKERVANGKARGGSKVAFAVACVICAVAVGLAIYLVVDKIKTTKDQEKVKSKREELQRAIQEGKANGVLDALDDADLVEDFALNPFDEIEAELFRSKLSVLAREANGTIADLYVHGKEGRTMFYMAHAFQVPLLCIDVAECGRPESIRIVPTIVHGDKMYEGTTACSEFLSSQTRIVFPEQESQLGQSGLQQHTFIQQQPQQPRSNQQRSNVHFSDDLQVPNTGMGITHDPSRAQFDFSHNTATTKPEPFTQGNGGTTTQSGIMNLDDMGAAIMGGVTLDDDYDGNAVDIGMGSLTVVESKAKESSKDGEDQ